MEKQTSYVAFDFETANRRRFSVCALGIAVIEDGQVVEKGSCLIKPPDLDFENSTVHGITREDVEDKPKFDELWPLLEQYFQNRSVVAHSASFDVGALREVLGEYGIVVPSLRFLCTRRLAKRVWPELGSYGLASIAAYLGVQFRHHDPAEDAFACAQIVVRGCQERGVSTLEELADIAGIAWGRLWAGGFERCRVLHEIDEPPAYETGKEEVQPSQPADPRHPLFGKTVVLANLLGRMSETEAAGKITKCGGVCSQIVDERTDYVVVGDHWAWPKGLKTSKLMSAEALVAAGGKLEIISEHEIVEMLTFNSCS
jgi:DNA polymerase-3 subunit epsilon